MIYELKNEELAIKINSVGAELISVRRGNCEYMWQKDPAFWQKCSPVLFPICGRLLDGKYTYEGKTYEMTIHGFAARQEFSLVKQDEKEITLLLTANEETRASYPFEFNFYMTYRLEGGKVTVTSKTENKDAKVMPFTYGAHPGFNLPMEGQGEFADYGIRFENGTQPQKLVFSEACLDTGKSEPFALNEQSELKLKHSLFDNDAIFLKTPGSEVTLAAENAAHSVTVNFAGFPYLGIWHRPKMEAPFVCIEPWYGLPAHDGVMDDLATKGDMFHLAPNAKKTITYSMLFK